MIVGRWYLCLLIALVTSCSSASDPGSEAAESLGHRIEKALNPWFELRDFMGVVGIQARGRDPVIVTLGWADHRSERPHVDRGKFLIGSVSKQFTAVLILLLEEDGLLSTSDSVADHLPTFKPEQPITIEQLLGHTSGVADIYSLGRFGTEDSKRDSLQSVVDQLASAPLTHPPGTQFTYSNGGYAVLARLIETIEGKAFATVLHQRILEPLGLGDTGHGRPVTPEYQRVIGHEPMGLRGLTIAPSLAIGYSTGSGSMYSTAQDLLRWSLALHGGDVLSAPSYAKLSQASEAGYGLGISVFKRFGRSTLGHDGRVPGFASDLAHYVEDDTSVVVLSNVQSVARDEVRRATAATLFGEPVTGPSRPELVREASTEPRQLTGSYGFGPSLTVTVALHEGRLTAQANNGQRTELIPVAGGGWFSRMLYTVVRFGRDENGRFNRLTWGAAENAPSGARQVGG